MCFEGMHACASWLHETENEQVILSAMMFTVCNMWGVHAGEAVDKCLAAAGPGTHIAVGLVYTGRLILYGQW